MPERFPSARVRRVLSLVVAALLGSGLGSVYLRQGPKEVTVDDAVAAFRSASPAPSTTVAEAAVEPAGAPGAPAPDAAVSPPATAVAATGTASGVPATPSSGAAPAGSTTTSPAPSTQAGGDGERIEEGVYTYATEGFEATNALGGARHDYPKETPVTMRRSDCGWTQRWQPLAERWDESALCRTDAGTDVRRFTTYHEFFQRSQQQQFDCPPGSVVQKRDAQPGATWSWRCTAGASAIDTVVTVVGPEPVTVEGVEIPAVRVHYESTMTGANRGTQKQDRWIRGDGMNLRIKTDIDTEADSPFGAVHYEEHYVITIVSLSPRR